MAGLIKRRGIYYAQFKDPTRTPPVKRISLKTRSRKVAQQRLAELLADPRFDPWKPVEEKTLADAFIEFLREKERRGCTAHTLRSYETFVGRWIDRVGAGTSTKQVTKRHVEDYTLDPSVSPATRLTRHRHVRCFLRWLVRRGLLDDMPDLVAPKSPEKMPKAVRLEELERICRAITEDYQRKLQQGLVKEGELIWAVDAFRFAFYTGLRGGEVARLRWRDVQLERRAIVLHHQKSRREQVLPISEAAARILQRLARKPHHPDDWVFAPPGSRRTSPEYGRNKLSKIFAIYRRRAGIERHVTLHGLRHGFCTVLAEAGASAAVIAQAARHADVRISMRYIHMTPDHLKRELDRAIGGMWTDGA